MGLCVCFLAAGMPLKERSSEFLGRPLGMAYGCLGGVAGKYDAQWGQEADPVAVVAVAVIAVAAGKDSEWDDEISCLNVSEIEKKNRK